jgi:hypothetical protein
LAVKTIEQGKTLIWTETYDLRASTGRLPIVDPGLTGQLVSISATELAEGAELVKGLHLAAAIRYYGWSQKRRRGDVGHG